MDKALHKYTRLLWALTGDSYAEISEKTGVSRGTINYWGKRHNWVDFRETLRAERRRGPEALRELQEGVTSVVAEVHSRPPLESDAPRLRRTLQLLQAALESGEIEDVPEIEVQLLPAGVQLAAQAAAAEMKETKEWVADAQEVNDRHFELFEAFHELIRSRLSLSGGRMEDPGPALLPANELLQLLQAVAKIQDGQRKAMGIEKDDPGGGSDIFIEYTNLRNRLGEEGERVTVSGGDLEDRAQALEFAQELLRKHGVAFPADLGAQAHVVDVEPAKPAILDAMAHVPELRDQVEEPSAEESERAEGGDAIDAGSDSVTEEGDRISKPKLVDLQARLLSGLRGGGKEGGREK